MSAPRLSVVIPSYDGRPMLAACLQSLRSQTLAREAFEIVVVDNGSADDTAAWLRAAHPDVCV
ncbi:MAG TPA: glycosyltransferase, partial [Vicinamibacteria bacterium]|nr:glycosyltransferase [Vicinamibacteria bacterium]